MDTEHLHYITNGANRSDGLDRTAISDRYAQITVFADLLQVYIPSTAARVVRATPPPKRARITRFTNRSRNRMLMKLAMARNWVGGFFITLTYPGEFTHSLKEAHTHLANMRKRVTRQFPGCRSGWRMEIMPRQRGASRGETSGA